MSLTFGKPDPNLLRSSGATDFNNFTSFSFKSIGKEPELLKRISSREEGVNYHYSPSPEPESRPAHYGAEGRTRPSLLQALTNDASTSSSQGLSFSMAFDSFIPDQPVPAAETSSAKSPGIEYDLMQLQYPETPIAEAVLDKPLSPPPPPPFVPDYSALKKLHARLETSHTVLAAPPPPRKAQSPPPDFPRPSLIAANNAVHHTEKMHISAKEALQASQVRVSISEQGVSSAQTIVDTLSQALLASRAALEVAQKALEEARQAAEEAQAVLTASRAAADAAEETKRLLEEPPPPRAPTPEPVTANAEIIDDLKKDLDTLKLWVEEQEAGHMPAPTAAKDTSRDQEEEEEREASNMMTAPDATDTDVEVRDANDTSADTSAFENPGENGGGGEIDMDMDEPRRVSEEDAAAEALVTLADQKTKAHEEDRPTRATPPPKGPMEQGNAESSTVYAQAERSAEQLQEDALAREATLRKLQDAQREKVRLQKVEAHAAAALSIRKEREDAAAKSAAQPSVPLSDADAQHQFGNVAARAVVLPPSTAATMKINTKKAKPVSGGVKLGPDVIVKVEPSLPGEPSPALERAAALGLRVRAPLAKGGDSKSAPSSKIGPSKKTRNYSLPPISYLDRESSPSDEISIYRTGSDKGDIHIIPPTKAPKMHPDLSTDIQLINLRFALEDEGITWEAISRSRPKFSVVKTEEPENVALPPIVLPLLASQSRSTSSLQPPLLANPQIVTPIPSASATAPTVAPTTPLKPLPSRKQLPKINKLAPPTTHANHQAVNPAAAPSVAQPEVMPRSSEDTTRPSEAQPVIAPPKWSPPAVVVPVASTHSNGSAFTHTPNKVQALPTTQTEAFARSGSGTTTPVPDVNDSSSYRPLSERVSNVWRGRSPSRYDPISPRPRSRTPERYASTSYNGEPVRNGRRSPDSYNARYPGPSKWMPEPARRAPTPPRAYTPPRAQRPASPPPSRRHEATEFPAKRTFSGDHYSPAAPRQPSATTNTWPRHDSPPRGPRHGIPRAPSNPQKRPREDDYTPPVHPQKRFKDDASRIPAREASPPRTWSAREPENERPTLERRLGAPDPNVHYIGRGESYRPQAEVPHQDGDESSKPEGLLSRLSDPNPGTRGRGGPRGRPNRARGGRGRGERSLADRMD